MPLMSCLYYQNETIQPCSIIDDHKLCPVDMLLFVAGVFYNGGVYFLFAITICPSLNVTILYITPSMPKSKIIKISKEERMQEDCLQYTADISLLQNLRKRPISEKITQTLDSVLDVLLRVLMSLQRKIQDNDITHWADISTVRHQMRSRVKRIENQIHAATKQCDVPSETSMKAI